MEFERRRKVLDEFHRIIRPYKEDAELLQACVLGFGFLQDGDVGIGAHTPLTESTARARMSQLTSRPWERVGLVEPRIPSRTKWHSRPDRKVFRSTCAALPVKEP